MSASMSIVLLSAAFLVLCLRWEWARAAWRRLLVAGVMFAVLAPCFSWSWASSLGVSDWLTAPDSHGEARMALAFVLNLGCYFASLDHEPMALFETRGGRS